MEMKVRKKKGSRGVAIEGEMTIYSARTLKEGLSENLSAAGALELDLKGVSAIDTAGFQILVLLRREAESCGKIFRILRHSQPTKSLTELYDMTGYLEGGPGAKKDGGAG